MCVDLQAIVSWIDCNPSITHKPQPLHISQVTLIAYFFTAYSRCSKTWARIFIFFWRQCLINFIKNIWFSFKLDDTFTPFYREPAFCLPGWVSGSMWQVVQWSCPTGVTEAYFDANHSCQEAMADWSQHPRTCQGFLSDPSCMVTNARGEGWDTRIKVHRELFLIFNHFGGFFPQTDYMLFSRVLKVFFFARGGRAPLPPGHFPGFTMEFGVAGDPSARSHPPSYRRKGNLSFPLRAGLTPSRCRNFNISFRTGRKYFLFFFSHHADSMLFFFIFFSICMGYSNEFIYEQARFWNKKWSFHLI